MVKEIAKVGKMFLLLHKSFRELDLYCGFDVFRNIQHPKAN